MKNSMIKDYKELVIKPQYDFLRRHWKGYLGLTVAFTAGPFVVYKVRNLVEDIKMKREFKYFEEEES